MSGYPPQRAAVVRTRAARELVRLLHRSADVGTGEWVAGALEEPLVLSGVVDAHSAVLDCCKERMKGDVCIYITCLSPPLYSCRIKSSNC